MSNDKRLNTSQAIVLCGVGSGILLAAAYGIVELIRWVLN